MTKSLYQLGLFCFRRKFVALGVWIVLAVALGVLASRAGENTSNSLSLPGSNSQQATDLLAQRFPQQANGTNPIVVQVPSGTVTDPANAAAINSTVASLQHAPNVTQVVNPLTPAGAAAVSPNGTIAYIPVTLAVGPGSLTVDQANAVVAATQPAQSAGLRVASGGYLGQTLSKPDVGSSDAIGIGAAMVILLFAFGTVVAMGLPIATAVLGLVSGLSIIAFLSHITTVPTSSPTLATMIGLGVGIDYALFIVTRYRQQRAEGLEISEAAGRAVATGGGAVAFAGTTVVVALCSLLLAGIPLVTTLGYTAAIAVVIAVLAALTLLPALLGLVGPHIESLHVPGIRRGVAHHEHSTGWTRWAEGVARRPWSAIAVSVAVLVVLSIPLFSLTLGQEDVGALPTSTTARQAYDMLDAGFGPGVNGPLVVAAAVGTPVQPPSALSNLQQAIAAQPGVKSVSPPQLNASGNAAVFNVIPTTAPSADQTSALVKNLRSNTVPAATRNTNVQAYVGGLTASYVDLASAIASKLFLVIVIVICLAFALLALAFRSLIVPAKAAIMNLLSVAAAYGVLTAVFQFGWGASLLGLDHGVPIVSFVPLMMFAILFGLSMDYEVFLLTQIRERYTQTGDSRESVISGLSSTGRVITSAAAIMVCVFLSFVFNGDPTVKQFGVGLAVAVAIDATLVRCFLVPAVMVLLGRPAWWLPEWLGRWMPPLNIEGESFFKPEAERASIQQPRPRPRPRRRS